MPTQQIRRIQRGAGCDAISFLSSTDIALSEETTLGQRLSMRELDQGLAQSDHRCGHCFQCAATCRVSWRCVCGASAVRMLTIPASSLKATDNDAKSPRCGLNNAVSLGFHMERLELPRRARARLDTCDAMGATAVQGMDATSTDLMSYEKAHPRFGRDDTSAIFPHRVTCTDGSTECPSPSSHSPDPGQLWRTWAYYQRAHDWLVVPLALGYSKSEPAAKSSMMFDFAQTPPIG